MAKIVLVWEMGADLGHVTRLDALARHLSERGHIVTAIFCDTTGVQQLYPPLTTPPYQIVQGPTWPARHQKLSRPPASLAEVLLSVGFYRAQVIVEKLVHWRTLFANLQADIILYDYAPTALLATRQYPCKRVNLSDPFSKPPACFPLPRFDQTAKVSEQNLATSEQRLVATTNQALREVGLKEIAYAHELFSADKTFLLSIRELDPFAHLRKSDEDYTGQFEIPSSAKRPITWSTGSAKKVFAYLKPSYPQLNNFLKALTRADVQGRFFIPNATSDSLQICRDSNIEIATTPYDLSNLSQCDLTICHSGHSTLLGGILRGVPSLLIPLQQEQMSVARKAVSSGFALILGHGIAEEKDILMPLNQLLVGTGFRRAAQDCAMRYQNHFAKSTLETVVEYVESCR